MPTKTFAPSRCFGLVPCAGNGSRSGLALPKQYANVAGAPLVSHTLRAMAGVDRMVSTLVALAPGDTDFERLVALPSASPGKFIVVHCGAATRAGTVAAGLQRLAAAGAEADDWVLVHDAARCLVRHGWIDALIDACFDDPVGGLLAVPVADTLKREAGGRATETVPRASLWQAQTPQMFRLGMLAEALAAAGDTVTDEAGAIERLGLQPKLVPGSAENLKVTHASDLALAEAILRTRGES